MVNFTWPVHLRQTVEVLPLQPWKRPKRSRSNTCGDSQTFTPSSKSARQCTSTHRLRDGWVFGSSDAWFYAPMLLSVDTMKFFISESDKVYHQSMAAIQQLSAPVAASSCLYPRHILTSAFHHGRQKVFNQPPHSVEIYWIGVFSDTLVKISCKFIIIWVNYEKQKKCLFVKHRVYSYKWLQWMLCTITIDFRNARRRSKTLCHTDFDVWVWFWI